MTCIVAIEHEGTVYMGSDRAQSAGHTVNIKDVPKVFTNGPALIGTCGSVRVHQVLRYCVEVPEHTLTWDVDRWMVTDLVPAIRAAFQEHGIDKTEHGVSKIGSSEFLFAIRGRCYIVQADYSWCRSHNGEYATGSGEDHAFGSLHSTRTWDDPAARVIEALESAAEKVVTVAGPFDIITQVGE